MSPEFTYMAIFLVGSAIMGFPLGIALFGSGIFYFLLNGQDPTFAAEIILHSLFSNFVLLAVPLFIFAANIMNSGKITDRILEFALALVGHFRGGLAHVNIVTSLFFAGMSGAATADVAGVGTVLMKMMREKQRYTDGFAAAITGASATIGPIFPPSIMLIFYALVTSTSIGQLFMAGIVPGILMAFVLMATVAIIARRRNFPVEQAVPWAAMPVIFVRALFPLLMPVILLGGIYSGAFTPTEAAAIAALYALLLSVLGYRALNWRGLLHVFGQTAVTTAVVTTLIFGAFVFSYVITAEQIPQHLASWLNSLEMSRLQFLLAVNVLLLVLGTVLASATIILVIVPILMPTALVLGVDPVHFGIVAVLNVTIGLMTPPYGVVLFVISGLTGIPIGSIVRESWILIGALIFTLLILVLVPDLALFLPAFLSE